MIALALVGAGVAALVGFRLMGNDGSGEVTPIAWSAEAFQGGPRLAVDRTEVDDGAVRYGQTVKATFRLKNVGDQVLTLRQPAVETLEGC